PAVAGPSRSGGPGRRPTHFGGPHLGSINSASRVRNSPDGSGGLSPTDSTPAPDHTPTTGPRTAPRIETGQGLAKGGGPSRRSRGHRLKNDPAAVGLKKPG